MSLLCALTYIVSIQLGVCWQLFPEQAGSRNVISHMRLVASSPRFFIEQVRRIAGRAGHSTEMLCLRSL